MFSFSRDGFTAEKLLGRSIIREWLFRDVIFRLSKEKSRLIFENDDVFALLITQQLMVV